MEASPDPPNEKKLWLSAFVILILVSLWMLTMRLSNDPFLALEFEVTLVYLPTVLGGIIALYLSFKAKPEL